MGMDNTIGFGFISFVVQKYCKQAKIQYRIYFKRALVDRFFLVRSAYPRQINASLRPIETTVMLPRILKAVWFFSLLVLFALFLYVYASLPEAMTLAGSAAEISREVFFYGSLVLVVLVNASVYLVARLNGPHSVFFLSWYYGCLAWFNVLLAIIFGLISLFNSQERFDMPRLPLIVYSVIAVLGAWVVGGLIYLLKQKLLLK